MREPTKYKKSLTVPGSAVLADAATPETHKTMRYATYRAASKLLGFGPRILLPVIVETMIKVCFPGQLKEKKNEFTWYVPSSEPSVRKMRSLRREQSGHAQMMSPASPALNQRVQHLIFIIKILKTDTLM